MAELFVFATIASIAAFYSVLPEYQRLRIQYALHPNYRYIVIIGALAVVVLYLGSVWLTTAQPTYRIACSSICFPGELWIETAQVAIVLSISSYFFYVLIVDEPTIQNDSDMATLLRGLFSERDFDTLISVISDNYRSLVGDPTSELPQSRSITETYLNDERLVRNHSQLDPSLAIQIFSDRDCSFDRATFARRYLRGLYDDSTSILYHEIEHNRQQETRIYHIPESNIILYTLFDNPTIAKELRVWDPIREGVKVHLRDTARKTDNPYIDRNDLFSRARPVVLYRDPVFVGVRFFDIMAVSALSYDLEHHMFVHFLAEFSEQICNDFEMGPNSDPSGEFPNDYAYLLNEIVDHLQNTILLAKNRSGEVRRDMSSPDCQSEDDILKMYIWTLIRTHKAVLLCSNIPNQFQSTISEKVIDTYLELGADQDPKTRMYAICLQNYVLSNSNNPIRSSGYQQYRQRFRHDAQQYAPLLSDVRGNLYEVFLSRF